MIVRAPYVDSQKLEHSIRVSSLAAIVGGSSKSREIASGVAGENYFHFRNDEALRWMACQDDLRFAVQQLICISISLSPFFKLVQKFHSSWMWTPRRQWS